MKKALVFLLALVMLMSLAFTAGAATSGELHNGDNEIELPWKANEASVFTYTATQTGTLYVTATSFSYSHKGGAYKDNSENMSDWNGTSFTVDGQALEHLYYGSVQVVEGQTYTFSWKHLYVGDFGWKATLNLSYTADAQPKPGSEEAPVELYRDDLPKGTVWIDAGETAYYTLYEFSGTCLCVNGDNAYVLITQWDSDAYEHVSRRYDAVDGVAVVPISNDLVTIQIGNSGATAKTFRLTWFYPPGTDRNPVDLVIGENTAITQEENYDGYYFTWTASCYGKLILTFPESGWMCTVRNVTKDEQGKTYIYDTDGAPNPLTVEASKGDVIEIIVNSFNNATLTVPGGDVIFTAAEEFSHFYGDPVVSEQPENCQGVGTRTQKCKLCKYEYVETFTGAHNVEAFPEGKAATCNENGLLPHWYCASCGTYFADEALTQTTTLEELTVPMLEHSYAVSGTTAGTCVLKSTTTYTCAGCGHSYTEEGALDDTNHQNTKTVNETAATCLIDGYTGDLVCADCGVLLTEGQAVAATGHSFTDWTTTEDGRYRSRSCTICAHEETEDLGCQHRETQVNGAVEATCTTAGYTGDVCCVACGKVMESGTGVPAKGHSCDCTATTPGTCVTKSTSIFTCSVCGYSYTETGSLDEDNHGETELKNAVSATCTAAGYTGDQVCADCAKVLAAGQKIDMLEHSFGEWIKADDGTYMVRTCEDCGYEEVENLQCQHTATDTIDVIEATCLIDGYTGDVVCMACGQILTEGTVVPATGHSFGDWVVTQEPTATVDGSQMRQCAACGEQETETIPATGEPATEPTEPPTEPTEPPTQPTEPPTEPTEPPTQPTEPGTEPTVPPTTQATQPTVPESHPTQPTVQPDTKPTQPATQQGGEQSGGGNTGIVIAIVVAVLVVGGLAVVLLKKKK